MDFIEALDLAKQGKKMFRMRKEFEDLYNITVFNEQDINTSDLESKDWEIYKEDEHNSEESIFMLRIMEYEI